MKTADHLQIGTQLAKQYLQDVPTSYQKAFILGNIFPDLNFFTYLRGSLSRRKIQGHHFESAAGYIQESMQYLQRVPKYQLYQYFRLGELMHYIADAFTYPHNSCFSGTLKQHMEYEEVLHQELIRMGTPYPSATAHLIYVNHPNLWAEFEKLHAEYGKQAGSPTWDLCYIAWGVRLAMDILVESKGNWIIPYWRFAS